jgi:hypothetical protein
MDYWYRACQTMQSYLSFKRNGLQSVVPLCRQSSRVKPRRPLLPYDSAAGSSVSALSSEPNRASFSFCAFKKASLKRLAFSELPNRIASVTASGSPSLTSAAAFQTQDRSLPTLGDSFISGTTRTGRLVHVATLLYRHKKGREGSKW